MASVRMGDAVEFLQFEVPERGSDIDPADDGYPPRIWAHLHFDELSASTYISGNYATGFADLVAYFDGLERDWRGWSGVRKWQSLDRELTIEARHDGHIQLEVGIERAMCWTASAEMTLEPGEELSHLAAGLRCALTGA